MAPRTTPKYSSLAVLCLFFVLGHASAQTNFKMIANPGGGEIVYGRVADQTTLSGAMGEMLRSVHTHFGERPQIGKFFQTKGTNSVATFFTLTSAKEGGKHIAGMVIVSLAEGQAPASVVLYDDAQRFATTANPMMKKLDEVWHPGGAAGPHAARVDAASTSAPAASLRETPFPDNSGSIGLPANWRITSGYQGAVHAEGPNGEQIHFGVIVPVMDPSNPQTRQMIEMETQGGRVPLPGSYVAYPFGSDLVRAFAAVSAQTAQKNRTPVPTYHFTKTTNSGQGCVLADGDVDRHDGKGLLAVTTLICASQPQSGTWLMTLYQSALPPGNVEREKATMGAIGSSYKLNNGVINNEAASNIQAIRQIGHDAVQRSRDSETAFEGQIAAHDANEDRIDRSNQAFSNYLLDQTVVRDNDRNERATVYNQYADSLVKADPERFQYVPTQDMIKGVDY